jgi:RNA polymerase sigma factor (sigma-70 family)
VRRADERAFETLYHRYHRRITAYIFGMVHDHGRAEDIAQDVFVSALRRMRETDRPIAFKPWIYEIAKNACIDQFRRSRRAEEISYDAEEGMGAADYGRLVSSEAVPEAQLESKQQLDHLRGAFGGLSETHHEILVMRELEGLSYREIGERLGMSRPSVESTLFRARRRLTEEYEELVTGARCQRIQAIIGSASAGEVGLRDQRRLARHVSHCQPCRRQARLAGVDVPVTSDRPVRQRIAAMLPLPLFLRRRWLGDVDSATGTSQLSTFAHWSAQLGSTFDPSWIKAAVTAATVAVAGVGAGIAANDPAAAGLGTSISPVADSRSGVHDELASRVTQSLAGVQTTVSTVQPSATAGPTPARSTASAGTTTGSAGAGSAGTPGAAATDEVASAVPGVDEVTGNLPSSPSAPSAPQPSGAPSQPSVPSSSLPTPPSVSTPVSAPDPANAVTDVTDTLSGATKDTTDKVGGLVGG